jgi:hypothetical protein
LTLNAHSYYQPAWVFRDGVSDTAKSIAEAASHEAGHTLGLRHDGLGASTYYLGPPGGLWAPIMGTGYYNPVTQFSNGDYGGNNQEDDFAVIAAHGGLPVVDESNGQALIPNVDSSGVIGYGDTDSYTFFAAAGDPVTITASTAQFSPNLDLKLTLTNPSGVSDPPVEPQSYRQTGDVAGGMSASVSFQPTSSGTFTVAVAGSGTPGAYSSYGSVGRYAIRVSIPPKLTVGSGNYYENVLRNTPILLSLTNGFGAVGDRIEVVDSVFGSPTPVMTLFVFSRNVATTITLPLETPSGRHSVRYVSGGSILAEQLIFVGPSVEFIGGEPVDVGGQILFSFGANPVRPGDRVVATLMGASPDLNGPSYEVPLFAATGAGLIPAPLTAGTFAVQYLSGGVVVAQSATFRVTRTKLTLDYPVFTGKTVSVTLTDGEPGSGNWVSFVQAGSPLMSSEPRRYISGTQATFDLVAPQTAGNYEIRYFLNDSLVLGKLVRVFVLPSPVVDFESTLAPAPGQQISANLRNNPNVQGSWVALAPMGSPVSTIVSSVNIGDYQSAISLAGPAVAGRYVIRYFAGNGFRMVAESAPFNVQAPQPPSGNTGGPSSIS